MKVIIGDKGVCRLSVIPVRNSGNDRAEMVTQLLFGDHYEITGISEDYKWAQIKIYFDEYEGWIDIKQHYAISKEYFDQINKSNYKICTDLTSNIFFKKHHIQILMGSVLPISSLEIFKMEEQLAFNGESKSLGQKMEFEFVKNTAKKYLNAPYLWGGKSPFGIDCSGFTQMVFKISGFRLKRDASQQVTQGVEVGINELKVGDLCFFGSDDTPTHVGIMLDDGKIIHASGKVKIDNFSKDGITLNGTGELTHKYLSSRRVLKLN